MKINKRAGLVCAVAIALATATIAFTQTPALLKRTITKTDKFDFGAGGTVAIAGTPNGSIRVVGTAKNEIEITAQIEIEAATEADLATLAAVTTFITDESPIRTGIISVGIYNKFGSKPVWKKFPKKLLNSPYRIDYVISVPHYSDLEIDGGKGDLSISGVEGSMQVNFLESNATVEIVGGDTVVTVEKGTVDLYLGGRTWRARSANVQVGVGNLNVRLPSTVSADIDAIVLRIGTIENTVTDLKPRDRKVPFTDKLILAKSGVGGVSLKFTVGDGTLRLERPVFP